MGKKRQGAEVVDFRQRSALLLTQALPEPLRNSQGVQSEFVELARRAMRPKHRSFVVREGGKVRRLAIQRRACGIVQKNGERFWFYDFGVNDLWRDYEVLVRAPIDRRTLTPMFDPSRPFFLRIDSGCTTGQVFHDASCECRDQLHKAIELLIKSEQGLIIRIPRQDGRGMGLQFKLSTLLLQYIFGTDIFDTVEAAVRISGSDEIDCRTYGGAIAVLKFLKAPRRQLLRLATQNACKTNALVENGFTIEHVSIRVPETKNTRQNMDAKRKRLGHRE